MWKTPFANPVTYNPGNSCYQTTFSEFFSNLNPTILVMVQLIISSIVIMLVASVVVVMVHVHAVGSLFTI